MIKFVNQIRSKLAIKDITMANNTETEIMYTEDQLMARLRFFIGICLALTLTGIVFVVLYSIIFVTQPLNAISPIDQKFFELIIPIATFLTGTLSGIMLAGGDKDLKAKAMDAANKPAAPAPGGPGLRPAGTTFGMPNRNAPSFTGRSTVTPGAVFTGAAVGASTAFVASTLVDDGELIPGQSPKFTDDN